MKRLLFLALLISGFLKAQDSVSVSIANWKNEKKGAAVFTFDDWSPGHGSVVYPLFKKHGLPATFYITLKNKDYSGGFKTMKKAYADGFEIGNHTHDHSDLSKLDSTELHREIFDAQKVLRKKVNPKCANTFAFPYGVFTKPIIAKTQTTHIGARLANLSYGRMWKYSLTYGKTDYFQLQTFMGRDIHSYATYGRLAKSVIKQGGMIVFMYHSVYNDSIDDKWFGAVSEDLLEVHLKAVKQHQDSIWITTFEKAVMYHKEKAKTSISVEKTGNQIKVKLENPLNEDQYFEPLTVLLNGLNKEQIKSIKVKSSKEKIEVMPQKYGSDVRFNILPYDKEIIIEI